MGEETFTGWLASVFTAAILILGSPLTTAWAAFCAATVFWGVTSCVSKDYTMVMSLLHLSWSQNTTASLFFVLLFVVGTIRKFI